MTVATATTRPIGVNYQVETPYAYCHKLKWNIKPLAHTKKVMDKVIISISKYEDSIRQLASGNILEADRLRIYESATKEILELTLEKFSYAKAANDPQAGPGLLGKLAMEVKDFLAHGGKPGMLLLQMQLDSMSGISSRTSQT